jgi:hypothetical protein
MNPENLGAAAGGNADHCVPITVMIGMYDYLKAFVLGGGCHAIIRPDHPGSEDI